MSQNTFISSPLYDLYLAFGTGSFADVSILFVPFIGGSVSGAEQLSPFISTNQFHFETTSVTISEMIVHEIRELETCIVTTDGERCTQCGELILLMVL